MRGVYRRGVSNQLRSLRQLRQRDVSDPMRLLRDMPERNLQSLQSGRLPDLRGRRLQEHMRRPVVSRLRRWGLREPLRHVRYLCQRPVRGQLRSRPVPELPVGLLQAVLRSGLSNLQSAGLPG